MNSQASPIGIQSLDGARGRNTFITKSGANQFENLKPQLTKQHSRNNTLVKKSSISSERGD